jgi:Cellulase (glycosyl hydrolase family 5)
MYRLTFVRTLLLRGINVGSKSPSNSNLTSDIRNELRNAEDACFVGRPFPVDEADQHLSRIKGYGFNVIRFLITWEALEHAGPYYVLNMIADLRGQYDDDYINFVVAILQKCKDHGLLVFIDPHQDVVIFLVPVLFI